MPTAVITPALLAALRSHPQLPRHSWYFVAGVTLSALNRPDEIPSVFTYAIEHGIDGAAAATRPPEHDERLVIARKLREGLVKSAAIVGLPKVCATLSIAVPGFLKPSFFFFFFAACLVFPRLPRFPRSRGIERIDKSHSAHNALNQLAVFVFERIPHTIC